MTAPRAYHGTSGAPAVAKRRVALVDLRRGCASLARGAGLVDPDAETLADVYMRATLRGVGHHDIGDLPSRIGALREGRINPRPTIVCVAGQGGAAEAYDGDNGLGELCASFITSRAESLADTFGIGFCTIAGSNHFLAAAPYVERAAERGYLALIFSRTRLVMGVPGHDARLIGNQPVGFATLAGDHSPLLFDAALAYASYGRMDAMARAGQSVPSHWGSASGGETTTDPRAIMDGGVSHAIGGHKGFGLAILVELLTGVLSGGPVIDEMHPQFDDCGVHAHAAIVLQPAALMAREHYHRRVSTMLNRIAGRAPGVVFPGQRSYARRAEADRQGAIEVDVPLLDELNRWASMLGVAQL